MERTLKLLALLLLLTLASSAQVTNRQIQYVTSAPAGVCNAIGISLLTPDGTIYTCQSGTWAAATAGGGGGTVTSVSVTTANGVSGSVATATTTPAITLTLGNITPTSVSTGGTPPAITPGTGGAIALGEGTVPTVCATSAVDCLYANSTQHGFLASFNNGSYLPLVQGPASAISGHVATFNGTNGGLLQDGGVGTLTIASGAKALATGAISSAACTSAQTDTATGTATTDVIIATFNGDPTGVTGYVPLTTGMLTIIAYPTSNTVNFKVCNNTSSSITPGAITLNWRVVR